MQLASGGSGDWGSQIRRFRRTRGFKQSVLAEILSVDQATISRWEAGKQIPDRAIQRRLLDLIRAPTDEALQRHWVSAGLGEQVISTVDSIIAAASAAYSSGHGIQHAEICGRSSLPMYSEEGLRLRAIVRDRGFFQGDVASATMISRSHTLSGHVRDRCTKTVWTPVRMDNGKFVMRAQRITLDEEQFARNRQEHGPIRIVMMDDLSK